MEKVRCDWCAATDLYKQYHDEEWGVPSCDDQHLFEMLILEGNQAGLSWITVLNKRENYRAAFDGFNAEKMARYDDKKFQELITNPGIIRNKLKVNSAIHNAKLYLDLRERGTTLSDYLWQFTDGQVIVNNCKTMDDVPATTEVSDKMSKQLKKDGFKFVGSTIMYAYMQATGMVNDHIESCHRYQECIDLIK